MGQKEFQEKADYGIGMAFQEMGIGTFEITLMDEEYRGKLVVRYGGNVPASELISSVARLFSEEEVNIQVDCEENNTHAITDEDGYLIGVVLKDNDGNTTTLEDWESIQLVVVGVNMVDYEIA